MKHKNSDMPAMPLSGDAYSDFASYDGTSKTSYNPECQGITKREMMAMHAMQGLLASESEESYYAKHEDCAEAAVNYADALLKELEK